MLAESAVVGSLTSPADGATFSTTSTIGARIATIGVSETDSADVVATWTIPVSAFAGYGPEPQLSVYFDTSVSATLETADWSGNAASMFITAEGRVGDVSIGQSDAVVAQIARGDRATLDGEEHIAGFGSQVALTTAGGALVIEFRVTCFVAGSNNPFGFLAVSSCDARAVELSEARITVRPTNGP